MSDIYDFLYDFLGSWYMVVWLVGAGFYLRAGSLFFDHVYAGLKSLFKKKP